MGVPNSIEIIDVRTDHGLKTGKGAAWDTAEEAREDFERRVRPLDVEKGRHAFLADLRNANGDLVDTVRLDAMGFRALTGEEPDDVETYRRTDREHWAQARARHARHEAAKAAGGHR
jgi:hypothetical protein